MSAPLWLEWCELTAALGLPDHADKIYAELFDRYRAPERHYHNLDHLAEVLAVIAQLHALAENVSAVRLAAWFHDAVYDPKAKENEERSAELASRLLKDWPLTPGLLDHVRMLILLTKTHQAVEDRDAAVLLDADLAILGAPQDRYVEYARAIGREYDWVPEEAYRRGRSQVLRAFLNRPRIYHTDQMFAAREAQARLNLAAEIAAHSGHFSNTQ
jgi:predicted metal-dependent HD superfamily phosphohydrolase